MKKIIVLLLAIFLNCAYLNQVKTIKAIGYQLDSVEFKSFDFTGINLTLNILLFNPNKVDVTIEKIIYKIIHDEKVIGQGFSEKSFILKKNSNGIYSTNLKVMFNIFNTDILKKIDEKKFFVNIDGEIIVKTKYGENSFPFKFSKDLFDQLNFLKKGK